MTDIVIVLPMPPTTNNLFLGTGKKRVRTAAYNAWIADAGWSLVKIRGVRGRKIVGPIAVLIEVSELDSTDTWDLANREKATIDLLVTHGVIQGDHRPIVREITMRWAPDIHGVRVTLRPLQPQTVNEVLRAAAERLEGIS